MFLEGVLTNDGNKAIVTYSKIVDKYPKSRYADAALYRIFSFYYANGDYDKAKKNLDKLKSDYPVSPYLKIADRTVPSANQTTLPEVKNSNQLTEQDQPKYKFTIQAGAFTQSSNALSLKRILKITDSLRKLKIK